MSALHIPVFEELKIGCRKGPNARCVELSNNAIKLIIIITFILTLLEKGCRCRILINFCLHQFLCGQDNRFVVAYQYT